MFAFRSSLAMGKTVAFVVLMAGGGLVECRLGGGSPIRNQYSYGNLENDEMFLNAVERYSNCRSSIRRQLT